MYEMGKKINYEENVFYFPSCPKRDYIYMEACFQCCQLFSCLVEINQVIAYEAASNKEAALIDEAVFFDATTHCVVASLGEATSHDEVATLNETGSFNEAASIN